MPSGAAPGAAPVRVGSEFRLQEKSGARRAHFRYDGNAGPLGTKERPNTITLKQVAEVVVTSLTRTIVEVLALQATRHVVRRLRRGKRSKPTKLKPE